MISGKCRLVSGKLFRWDAPEARHNVLACRRGASGAVTRDVPNGWRRRRIAFGVVSWARPAGLAVRRRERLAAPSRRIMGRNRAFVNLIWDLPQFWCSIMARDSQSDQVLGAEAHEREVNRSQRARTYDA